MNATQLRFRLMQLKPKEQAAYVLHLRDKMSFAEIARETRMTEQEARQWYTQAVLKLARIPKMPNLWQVLIYLLIRRS